MSGNELFRWQFSFLWVHESSRVLVSAGSIPYVQRIFRARGPDVAVAVESKNRMTDVVRQERRAGVEGVQGARVIVMCRWVQGEVLRQKSTLWAKEGGGRWFGRKRDLRDVPDTDASEHRVELS